MRYRALPILLLFAVIAIIGTSYSSGFIYQKDPLRLEEGVARKRHYALILDIRTPKEREIHGFFPNSIPVDPARVGEEVPFLLGQKPGAQPPRSTPILVYSNAGDGRAQRVAEQLYDMGLIGTRYIKGSYLDMLP